MLFGSYLKMDIWIVLIGSIPGGVMITLLEGYQIRTPGIFLSGGVQLMINIGIAATLIAIGVFV